MDDSRIQELFDREAIKEIRYKFAEGLDFQDWPLIEGLLLPELDTDFTIWGLPPLRVSRTDFVNNFFKHNLSRVGLKTQHIFANFRIRVTGDEAICKSNLLAQHYLQGFEGGEEFFLRAEYTDQLLRTHDGWKISGVTLSALFYTSGNPSLLVS